MGTNSQRLSKTYQKVSEESDDKSLQIYETRRLDNPFCIRVTQEELFATCKNEPQRLERC